MSSAATTAGAVEFSIVGPAFEFVPVGGNFTINIVMTNTDGTTFNGVGASVRGYGANPFVSGQSVDHYLNAICVGPGACFGGLSNLAGGALRESSIGTTMFRVTFTAVERALIRIGKSYHSDGVILADGSSIQAQGTNFDLFLTPEPETALLLGLASLAATGRRE